MVTHITHLIYSYLSCTSGTELVSGPRPVQFSWDEVRWESVMWTRLYVNCFISVSDAVGPCSCEASGVNCCPVQFRWDGMRSKSSVTWAWLQVAATLAESILRWTVLVLSVSSACLDLSWSSRLDSSVQSSCRSSKSLSRTVLPSSPPLCCSRWLSMRSASRTCFVRDNASRF